MNGLLLAIVEASRDALSSTSYEWARLREFDDGRLLVSLVIAVVAAVLLWVAYVYRRDTEELSRPARVVLTLLRFLAVFTLLFFFLGLERRDRTEVVYNSQVVVLVDVSQSMGLREGGDLSGEQSRLDRVKEALAKSPVIDQLRQNHDVSVVRFADRVERVAFLPKRTGEENETKVSLPSGAAERPDDVDWSSLAPTGRETRFGDALVSEFREFQNAPLAGVIVFTDGMQNRGVLPEAVIPLAKEADVSILTVGLGPTVAQRNVAVSDFVVPARSYPGDTLSIEGYLQSSGYSGRSVPVELYARRSTEPEDALVLVDTERATLGKDGEVVAVKFEVEPEEAGRFVYEMRVVAPGDDGNPRDNSATAEIEISDRKTRVLLFAGGPTRDYHFIRNQLYRDRTMEVDVLLQTASGAVSQDANRILRMFPASAPELYDYDCLVAFDPDWTKLDADQISLLESWVAEEAGGMIVVAGSIHTAKWTRSPEHAQLKALYPVEFQQRLTLLDDGHHDGKLPWPIEFEPAGRDASFLWLESNAQDSQDAWQAFPGVYGYYGVKGAKPGATVYGRFSDPAAGLGSERPVYLAEQFYGAGRVFYMGSGELWRLRSLDPKYFGVLTTKLIRHVSQGRLLRGSSRGTLLADRDRYQVGDVVVLRARLTDAQREPLAIPSVSAQVIGPDQTAQIVQLSADPLQPGMYIGQFTVDKEGGYHVSLAIPDAAGEVLTRQVYASLPDLERGDLVRNEPLLKLLADQTGGQYFADIDEAVGDNAVALLPSREEVRPFEDAPDVEFARLQMHWILAVFCGALFMEWGLRRWLFLA